MCHAKCIFADPLQMSHVCHRFWKCYKTLTFCALLTRCPIPCACHTKRQSKSGANMLCFVHLDFEMCFAPQRRTLFRHVNFKNGSSMMSFVQFDLEMCFAPQRRTLFRHVTFQKRSEHDVLCTFWLGNVLRATAAYTFSTCQLPKVLWDRQFLTFLILKYASRHNGVNCGVCSALLDTFHKALPEAYGEAWVPTAHTDCQRAVLQVSPHRSVQLWDVSGAAGHMPQSTTRSIRRGMSANRTHRHSLPKAAFRFYLL